jgi:hypothetical protein
MASWSARLQLDFVFEDDSEVTITIRLSRDFAWTTSTTFAIDAFQARSVGRGFSKGGLISREWRVPEYTYTVNVPFVIDGERDAEGEARTQPQSSATQRVIVSRARV